LGICGLTNWLFVDAQLLRENTVLETAEALIQKTPGVLGGEACIRYHRIAVWMIVNSRQLGMTDENVVKEYPSLTAADLDACWDYYRDHPVEIERAIWFNDIAANVEDGVSPAAWVVVEGILLGLKDGEIRCAFEPPLSSDDLNAAWSAYRADPLGIGMKKMRQYLAWSGKNIDV
jgi:uncharacterized protein (DUF433 family)